jgi:hypothetical protein
VWARGRGLTWLGGEWASAPGLDGAEGEQNRARGHGVTLLQECSSLDRLVLMQLICQVLIACAHHHAHITTAGLLGTAHDELGCQNAATAHAQEQHKRISLPAVYRLTRSWSHLTSHSTAHTLLNVLNSS